MNESVLSGVIFAAQFSVAAIISAVGILVLAGTFIAVNRLLHMFWIPTNLVQKLFNLLNDKGAASKRTEPTVNYQYGGAIAGGSLDQQKPINYSNVPIGVPVKTPDGKIVVNVGEGGSGGIIRKTKRDKIDEKMEAAFKDGVDLSGKNTP